MKDAALQISDKPKKVAGKKLAQTKKSVKGKMMKDTKSRRDQK